MLYVRGADSSIVEALKPLGASVEAIPRGAHMPINEGSGARYLFCVGMNHQKPLRDQTDEEVAETLMVTAFNVIKECDRLLADNPMARICVVGSEAAFTWSFDGAYAAAKAALHRYVETKKIGPSQQLVCVAPTCVVGTRMNKRRNEDGVRALESRVQSHPKRRWLTPSEVAKMIHFLLCVDKGYTTGVVIRMNGGEHCWR